ncbi:MAG: cobyrinate a,c-diamide synthase, partial [Dehalococcoidales bacterium]|nr:cobyrinate a,c-diamide synthase [Dehalococcoidales bacterium]
TTSGVGKTTIATGLMGLLRRHGHKVQPFKTGPDYIDPTYHTWATGEMSRNLDTWLLSPDAVTELFARAAAGKDIAVIEGVMGLYDGHSGVSDEGSTAELAKLLNVPVILVVDSRKGARSLAAIVSGYQSFDNKVNICGVILNGIGSDGHLKMCREAIEHYNRIPVLGYLRRRDYLALPERHLGLIPTVEGHAPDQFLERLVSECEATFDTAAIMRLAEKAVTPPARNGLFPAERQAPVTTIAVARDKAFSFYYQDSLDILAAWGAELAFFSPMVDTSLPPDTSGIYIGGGFPELYGDELAANSAMRTAIKSASKQGMPIYAECGGLMYLGQSLRDLGGKDYPMAGVLSLQSRIDTPHLNMGYRTIEALSDGPLLRRGETVRGHEFDWSVLSQDSDGMNAYRIIGSERREGFQTGNILASYIHLHLASKVSMAQRFIEQCRLAFLRSQH